MYLVLDTSKEVTARSFMDRTWAIQATGVCAFVWEEMVLLHMLVQCFLASRCLLQSSVTAYCDVNTCLCAYAFGCACVRMHSGACVFGCSLLSPGCHGRDGSKHTHAVGYGGIQYTSNPGLKFLSKHVPVTCIGEHGLLVWPSSIA